MQKTLKTIWEFILPFIRNKYILSFVVFAVWISFFDTYDIIDRIKDVSYLRELEEERDFFKEEIVKYRRQIEELDENQESLEKFAREQHLMKAQNEDIYIILEEEQETVF